MKKTFKPKITLFHCINTFSDDASLSFEDSDQFNLKAVKLPCSSMVKDVFLLRAFEAGADAVVVMVCPEGACRYVEGNIRAKKRIVWVRNLLDEIGIGGRRLFLFNLASGNLDEAAEMIRSTLTELNALGPNPAK
jgi:F420-non-reducing hydrogenase iron-sulfur subunit